MIDKIPLIAKLMPKTLKGWAIYTLTITATVVGFTSYSLMQSERFQDILLKKIDKDSLQARFNPAKFFSVADGVLRDTQATTVVIWITSITGTTANKTVVFSLDKSVRGTITNSWLDRSSPIYATDELRLDMTHILEGVVSCGKFDPVSEVDRKIYEEGKARYYCSSAIPPTGNGMIGIFTVYFDRKPTIDSALKLELRKAAREVVYD